MMEDWTEKYRPDSIEKLVGNREQRKKIYGWLQNFDPKTSDPIVLDGPPGIGKTSSVHAIAEDLGAEITEINASDKRTEKSIGPELRNISRSSGFLADLRIVLIDEADNLDPGGAGAIRSAMDDATQPIVLTTNNLFSGVPKSIRERVNKIEFEYVDDNEIVRLLKYICKEEGVEWEERALQMIADDAAGDVRHAVLSLQGSVSGKENGRCITTDTPRGWDIPRIVPFVASDSQGHDDVAEILDDFEGMFNDIEVFRIPCQTKWEIVAAEWFLANGYEVSICPPFALDEMHNGIWLHRVEDLKDDENSLCFEEFFYNREVDWKDYVDQELKSSEQISFGWVPDQSETNIEEMWTYMNGSDISDIAFV